MSESGVDMMFDEAELDPSIPVYEIKSKTLPDRNETDLRNASISSRTQLKNLLMRQKYLTEERQRPYGTNAKKFSSEPLKIATQIKDVPPDILQVHTKLQNPTRGFLEDKRKEQIQRYVNGELNKNGGMISSSANASSAGAVKVVATNLKNGCSSAPDIGIEEASEADDTYNLLDDLISLDGIEGSIDPEAIEPFHLQLAQSANTYDRDYNEEVNTATHSCPADIEKDVRLFSGGRRRSEVRTQFSGEDDMKNYQKELERKFNHNQIERRRRYNINDRIKELGTLLPKRNDTTFNDLKQNKGSILKASVDYIRKLQENQRRLKAIEDQNRLMESTNRKLILRMQDMERMMTVHGISNTSGTSSNDMLEEVMGNIRGPLLKSEPKEDISTSVEELMDDHNPLCSSDPMFSTFDQ